jgi:hypothetical protein
MRKKTSTDDGAEYSQTGGIGPNRMMPLMHWQLPFCHLHSGAWKNKEWSGTMIAF